VNEAECTRYVVFAGEFLLELGGVDAQEFARLKDPVEQFEKNHCFSAA
jgi:hypothetical protein